MASAFSSLGFLADLGRLAWACELPTLLISSFAYVLSLERQVQVATRNAGSGAEDMCFL